MVYIIVAIKRISPNEMLIVDATDQKNTQFYIVDDKRDLKEKSLYQVYGKISNDKFEYHTIDHELKQISDQKYNDLCNDAIKLGLLTDDKKSSERRDDIIITTASNIQDAEVITSGNQEQILPTLYNNNEVQKDQLVPTSPSGLPSMADVDEYFKRYEHVKKSIIDESDYHIYTDKRTGKKKKFLKKSGFRKFIHAFGLKTEIIKINNRLYPFTLGNGKIVQGIEYEVMARVIAPNGQYTENVAICQQYEKGGNRTKHDILTTATTRAISRTISDLVAFGEVSYEEL